MCCSSGDEHKQSSEHPKQSGLLDRTACAAAVVMSINNHLSIQSNLVCWTGLHACAAAVVITLTRMLKRPANIHMATIR